jgi:hypothetical protein
MDLTLGHYTYTQMSDNRRPTVDEAHLLAQYGDETDACRVAIVEDISAIDPRAGHLVQQMNDRARDLNLALINRQITWGDYARQERDVSQPPAEQSSAATSDVSASGPPAAVPNAEPPTADAAMQRFDQWQGKKDKASTPQ